MKQKRNRTNKQTQHTSMKTEPPPGRPSLRNSNHPRSTSRDSGGHVFSGSSAAIGARPCASSPAFTLSGECACMRATSPLLPFVLPFVLLLVSLPLTTAVTLAGGDVLLGTRPYPSLPFAAANAKPEPRTGSCVSSSISTSSS